MIPHGSCAKMTKTPCDSNIILIDFNTVFHCYILRSLLRASQLIGFKMLLMLWEKCWLLCGLLSKLRSKGKFDITVNDINC
jgi:hypothetical protein